QFQPGPGRRAGLEGARARTADRGCRGHPAAAPGRGGRAEPLRMHGHIREESAAMMQRMLRSRRAIVATVGAAALIAGMIGLGPLALGQNAAAPPKEIIFARKILMDSISENMDDLEAMVAQGKIDLNEGRPHSNIMSVMLMAFPHLFPASTNEWKEGVDRDP